MRASDSARRPRRWRGCALLASLALAGALVLCVGALAGLRSGAYRPPWISQQIGPVRLLALETFTPDCALAFPCGRPLNVLDPNLPRYYTVWIVVSRPNAPPSSYRLLVQQVK